MNRGLAILGERLFMVTVDGMVVALDMAHRALVWQT